VNTDELLDVQRRFNEIQNMMFEFMRRTFSRDESCPCGKPLYDHCVLCGACVEGECGKAHIHAPKYGYAPTPDVLDSDLILEDALDAEFIG